MKGISLDIDQQFFVENGMIGVNNNNRIIFFYCSEIVGEFVERNCYYVKQWQFVGYLLQDVINTKSFTVILGKKKDLNEYIVYHLEKFTLQMDFTTFTQEIRLFEAFEFKKAVIHIRRWRGAQKSRNHDI